MATKTQGAKQPAMLPGYVTLDELWPTLNVDEAEVARLRAEMLQLTRAYKLVELRKAYGLTQAQLAERAGIDQPRVSRIERGDLSRIEVATLQALVAALGGELELLMHVGDDIYRLPLGESWHRRTAARKAKATGNATSTGKARSGSAPEKEASKVRAAAGASRKTQTPKAGAASAPPRAKAAGINAATSKSRARSRTKSA